MEQRPLLGGRGWRMAGWLVTAIFLVLTIYALVMLISQVIGGGV